MAVDLATSDRRAAPSIGAASGRARAALVAAGLVLVAVHVGLARGLPSHGPFILPDEGGYLGNAIYLAHRYGHPIAGYYGGYSLLLVPASLVAKAPHAFYQAVQFTNACLSLVTAMLAYLLARRVFPTLRPLDGALVAGLVVLEPYVFTAVHLGMSENAIVPSTLLAAYLLARYLDDGSLRFGIAAGCAASFAFWVTPRGILVVVAFLIAIACGRLRAPRPWSQLVAVAGATATAVLIGLLYNGWLRGGRQTPGVDRAESLPPFTKASTWRNFIAGIGGRIGYLGTATIGFALVGVVLGVVWAIGRRAPADDESDRAPASAAAIYVGAFAAASVLVTMAYSTLTTKVPRVDYLYYGRYVEGVAMPAVVVGAGWLVARAHARPLRARAMLPVAIFVATALSTWLVRLYPRTPPAFTESSINVLAVFALRKTAHIHGYLGPLVLGGALAGAVWLIAAISARAALGAALIVLAILAVPLERDYLHDNTRLRAPNDAVAAQVDRLARAGVTVRCAAYENPGTGWSLEDDVFLLPTWRFKSVTAHDPKCDAVVITQGRPPTRPGDWQLLGSAQVDNIYFRTAIWVDRSALPGDVAARVRRIAAVRVPTPAGF